MTIHLKLSILFILFASVHQILFAQPNPDELSNEIRLYRNEIFARHGRPFISEDLKTYFNSSTWYKVNKQYSDTLLSERETEAIQTLYSIEQNIVNYDSLEVKNAALIFHTLQSILHTKIDTTFLTINTFDNDLFEDTIATHVYEKDNDICIDYAFVKNGKKIWTDRLINPYLWMGNHEPFESATNNFFITSAIALTKCRAEKYVWQFPIDDIVISIGINDINKVSDQNITKSEYKKYLDGFKGSVLLYSQDESGGHLVIWYEPLQTFITFYQP
ncbi:YARHG domain-containing protein [Saccharicrinis sp. FJH62]|uniref:YARHG domain-containing protein n=1 Tax=Saccharicrinis sp. FJH62 TaxID=3344657 RepID=UPI0035D4A7D2